MQKRIETIAVGLAILAVGIALAVIGVLEFDRIALMEAAGRVHGLSAKLRIVYELLGKWGVLGVFGITGLGALIAGGEKLRSGIAGRPAAEPASEQPR